MSRWVERERVGLERMKEILHDELNSIPPYPDVVGDRRLIRFLRGRQCDVEAAVKQYREFLKWWKESNVEEVRNNILYGGMNHPFKFPMGEQIINLVPQIVLSPRSESFKGHVVTLDCMGFDANTLFATCTQEQILKFIIYTLEFRSLILEQLGHEREQEYLRLHPNPEDRKDGYGTIPMLCAIKDLKGLGLAHAGAKPKQLIKLILDVAVPNYSEYMGKTYLVNAPFIFQAIWTFVKTMLDAEIIAKVSLQGSNFLEAMTAEIPIECIPAKIGGKLMAYNEAFDFDLSETGPLSYVGCPLRHVDDVSSSTQSAAVSAADESLGVGRGQISAFAISSTKSSSGKSSPSHIPSQTPVKSPMPIAGASTPSPLTQSPTIATPKLPFQYRPYRWSESEDEGLKKMREALADQLKDFPPYPDIVGDRKLIRFLRGRGGNVSEAVAQYSNFLNWYRENNMIEIRHKILYENVNHPYKFPYGRELIELGPHIVISSTLVDNKGQPLVVETFNFNPSDVFKLVTIEQYLEFLKYCLEFRSLIFEQMSEEQELKYLAKNPDPATRQRGYGVICCMCSIRDLRGVGLQHMSSKAKQFLGTSLKLAIPNYPEILGKAHFINVPMLFNVLWMFIKPFLDSNIIEKVSLSATSAGLETLKLDIPFENLPELIGGPNTTFNEAFNFDTSPTGPFYYPGAPIADGVTTDATDASTSSSIDHLVPPNASTPVVKGAAPIVSESKAKLMSLQAKSLLKYSSRTEAEQEIRLQNSGFGLKPAAIPASKPPLPETHTRAQPAPGHGHSHSHSRSQVHHQHVDAATSADNLAKKQDSSSHAPHYLSTTLIVVAALLVCYLGDIGAASVIAVSVVVGILTALLPV